MGKKRIYAKLEFDENCLESKHTVYLVYVDYKLVGRLYLTDENLVPKELRFTESEVWISSCLD